LATRRPRAPFPEDPIVTEDAAPNPPRKRLTSATAKAERKSRIFSRLTAGWSYEAIAAEENLSRERVRQIVGESLDEREIDGDQDHSRLLLARLNPALRLIGERIEKGDLTAVDRLVRVLDRIDRYQSRAKAAQRAAEFQQRLSDVDEEDEEDE